MSDDASVWNPRDAVATISNYSSVFKERFVATGGQQLFTLTAFAYKTGENALMVFKNGVMMEPGVDFSETSATEFTLATGATASDVVVAFGLVGYINAINDEFYLGPKAAAPTVDNAGITLAAGHAGYTYWNTTSNNHWTWTGTVWQLTSSSVATSANLVSISDAGGFYTSSDVEAALQEISTDIRSTATGEGASLIGLEDAGAKYTASNVEAALAELTSTANGEGASIIGVEDAANKFTSTNVEGVLAELGQEYVRLEDSKASGTVGGAAAAGTWNLRDLVEVVDDSNICSVAANVITLAAGTYRISAKATAYNVDGHKLRLQNTTAAATLVLGLSMWSDSANAVQDVALLEGTFTVAAGQALELQHWTGTVNAVDGLGKAVAAAGITELYALVELWKLS